MAINTAILNINKINILLAVILLSAFVFILFVIFPILGQIQKNADRLVVLRQEKLILEDQLTALQDYKETARDVQKNLDALEDMFVNVQFPVDFVQFLENLASENDLLIEISSPAGGEEDGYAMFQLALRGTSPDFTRFIARLETGPYLVKIQQMQIQRADGGRISANVSLKALAK